MKSLKPHYDVVGGRCCKCL